MADDHWFETRHQEQLQARSLRVTPTGVTQQYLADAIGIPGLTALMKALPTTLPAQSGVLWNNGGVLSIS